MGVTPQQLQNVQRALTASGIGPQQIADLTRAITALTVALNPPVQAVPRVISSVAVGGAFNPSPDIVVVGAWTEVLPARPTRVKTMFARSTGTANWWISPHRVDTATLQGIQLAAGAVGAGGTFIDPPPCHKGPWFITADAGGTTLVLLEFITAGGQPGFPTALTP